MPKFENMPNIAAQVIGTPLLMHQGKLDNIMSWLGPRLFSGLDVSAAIQADEVQHRTSADYVVADGVAIIPVIGSLVHRGMSMNSSGITAYQALDMNLTKAINDPDVNSILLDIDSPGGQVSGCFDFAERLLEMRKIKPIIALANELAASAAYAIGSSATELVVTRTARVGSVGVVTAHIDQSEQLKENGVAVTYVFAGDHKVDGNPTQSLPDSVKASMQAEMNNIYQIFTGHVAKARGMDQQAVIDTQAQMYTGQQAVDAGLADRVGTLETEFERLKARNQNQGAGSRRFATRQTHEVTMSNTQTPAPAAETTQPVVLSTPPAGALPAASQETREASPVTLASTAQTAVTELTDAEFQAAISAAKTEAATEERQRCLSIMSSASDIGLSQSVAVGQIEAGATVESAGKVLLSIKEGIDANVQIQTSHSAGATASTQVSMPTYGDIYSRRNAAKG